MSVIRTARKDKYSPFGGKLIAKREKSILIKALDK